MSSRNDLEQFPGGVQVLDENQTAGLLNRCQKQDCPNGRPPATHRAICVPCGDPKLYCTGCAGHFAEWRGAFVWEVVCDVCGGTFGPGVIGELIRMEPLS